MSGDADELQALIDLGLIRALDVAGVRGCPTCGATLQPTLTELQSGGRIKLAVAWTCDKPRDGFHYRRVEPLDRYVS